MSSGVLVNVQCQSAFQQLSEGKRSLRYIIYKIEDKEVIVESSVSSEDVLFIIFFILVLFFKTFLNNFRNICNV